MSISFAKSVAPYTFIVLFVYLLGFRPFGKNEKSPTVSGVRPASRQGLRNLVTCTSSEQLQTHGDTRTAAVSGTRSGCVMRSSVEIVKINA